MLIFEMISSTNKKFIFILLLAFLGAKTMFAQNPNGWDTSWVSSFGGRSTDVGRDIKETSDGGFIIAGATGTFGNGSNSFYLIKTNKFGKHKWSKVIGTNNNDFANAVEIGFDGGYYISGYSNGILGNGYDGYLIKTDSVGNLLWTKNYGGNDWDFFFGSCIMPDGGLSLCGETYSQSKGGSDSYLVRTDQNGDTLWTRKIGTSGDDAFYCVKQKNNYIYVVGKMFDSLSNKANAAIYKIDFSGNVIKKDIFSTSVSEDVTYNGLSITNNNDILLCGTRTSNSGRLCIIRKINGQGFNQMSYTTSPAELNLRCVIEGNNNDVYTLGTSTSGGLGGLSAVYYRFDAGFSYLNGTNFGGSSDDEGYKMIRTSMGYAFIGTTKSYGNQNGSTDENVYLVIFNKHNLMNDYFVSLTEFQDDITLSVLNKNTIQKPPATFYPNPMNTSSVLTFSDSILEGQALNYRLFDQYGRLVDDEDVIVKEQRVVLTRKHLNAGLYHLRVKHKTEIIYTGTISID